MKDDLKKMKETEIASIQDPFTEEKMGYLAEIFRGTGIRVNVFHNLEEAGDEVAQMEQ